LPGTRFGTLNESFDGWHGAIREQPTHHLRAKLSGIIGDGVGREAKRAIYELQCFSVLAWILRTDVIELQVVKANAFE
jgi:hypothetical protein